MRALISAVLLFVSSVTSAAPQEPVFIGSITSFERFQSGAWVAVQLNDPAMQLTTAPVSPGLADLFCPADQDSCGSWIAGSQGLLRSVLTFDGYSISPDALPCTIEYYCSEYDPYSISRKPDGHFASFADQMYNERDGLVRFVRLFWDVSGDNWIPDGAIGFGSLYNLHDVTGSGSFSYEYTRDFVVLEGSIRGTFDITMGYAPTPGTLALLAMGGLVFGLRRHARSKVI